MNNPADKPLKTTRFLGLIFGLISLGLILAGLALFLITNSLSASDAKVQGTVVRLLGSSDRKAPVVEYVVNGTTYEHRSGLYSSPPAFAVGDSVTVLYDPNKPEDSRLDSYRAEWLVAFILGVVGLAFSIPAGILWLLNTPMKPRQSRQKKL